MGWLGQHLLKHPALVRADKQSSSKKKKKKKKKKKLQAAPQRLGSMLLCTVSEHKHLLMNLPRCPAKVRTFPDILCWYIKNLISTSVIISERY